MSSLDTPMPGLEKQRMLERVAQHDDALEYAAAELQADKEIVATAVAQYGLALAYAAAELQADKEIVATAVAQNGQALAHAAAEVNRSVENIGARRLYTVIERVFEELSFVAPDQPDTEIVIDKAYVNKNLDALLQSSDLSRYVL